MNYLVLVLIFAIAISLTVSSVYAVQQVSDKLTVLSSTTTPVFEFRDQGSKSYFFQIPDGSQRLEIFDASAGKTRLAISNAGNIGIGTTTPLHLLHLADSSPTVRIESSDGPATLSIRATNGNPKVTFADAGSSSYELRIEDGTKKFQLFNVVTGIPSITIQNNGNVGIGTTTPAEKLDVAGNIKLSGNIVSDSDICIGAC